jgi:hypothetical protein
MLASDSGYYTTHGIGHHAAYTRQTISSNSILVYNPGFIVEGGWREHVYSGGQSLRQDITRIIAPYTLDSAMTCASMNQVKILGKGYGLKDGSYRYSYIAGDMTKAYDEETVDEVTRHMISVMTDDVKCPMVFVTFDRITAKHAHFKKTVLLHSMTEPTVTDDGLVVITNTKDGNCGKLGFGTLIVQGIATSIDALSVGFTISDYDLSAALIAALIIAVVTFIICFFGVIIGKGAKTLLCDKAGIFGGAILIFIGLEIFISSFF